MFQKLEQKIGLNIDGVSGRLWCFRFVYTAPKFIIRGQAQLNKFNNRACTTYVARKLLYKTESSLFSEQKPIPNSNQLRSNPIWSIP